MTTTPRFYCSVPLQPHQSVVLPADTAHYARRVLRLKPGSTIILFDGLGGEYPAQLDVQGSETRALTGAHHPREAELAGDINLVQGLATADKMDWIIEKSVELGAKSVIPITAQRSVLQLRGERLEKRMQHWRRVAQSASEQCGRNRVLTVERPCTLDVFLSRHTAAPHIATLLCHPANGMPLAQALRHFSDGLALHNSDDRPVLNLIVGPEGGWSEPERMLAQGHITTSVQFGPRILRTETAGLALMAASTALLDWNTM